MRLVSRVGAFVLILVLAGCSARIEPTEPVSPSISASPAASPAVSSASPSQGTLEPLPRIEASWLAARAVSCGDGHFFSPAVLEVPDRAEEGPDPAAVVLRTYLAPPLTAESDDMPKAGWHRVAQTATKVQFVAADEAHMWVVGFFVGPSGGWELDLAGECEGTVQRPDGFGRADWWLDPRFDPPQDADQVVQAVLQERSCASGHSPDGRIAPPSLAYFENAIVVTMSVEHRPGGQDCPGNPEFRFKLRLDQPIGGRRLLDGGVFPPRDATQPPP